MPRLTPLILVSIALAAAGAAAFAVVAPALPDDEREPPYAMVRFVHASPNAEIEELFLLDADGNVISLEVQTELEYLDVTPFVAVPPADYEVVVHLAGSNERPAAEVVLPQSFGTIGGRSYTVALIGLVMPETLEDPDEGFVAWLQDLFAADPPDPSLQTMVLNGIRATPVPAGETDVRIAHAAPGTDSIDLVIVHPEDTSGVLATVSFGESSGYTTVVPTAGTLELRVAGSEAALIDLSGHELATGTRYAILLAGTPVEDVPLRVLLLPEHD
jgi:hypothetical protein